MQSTDRDTAEASLSELPPEARCLGCGYLLRGLPENVCPECGRAFDLADPTSIEALGRGRRSSVSGWDYTALGMTIWLALTPTCICGYMDWFSLLFTVPSNVAIWWGALTTRIKNPVARALYVILVAIASAMLLKNLADIVWFGHHPLLG